MCGAARDASAPLWVEIGRGAQRWASALLLALSSALGLFACSGTPPHSRVPDPRDAPSAVEQRLSAAQAESLWSQASEVFEARCVVCHGCYDAPCQLKLESYAGIVRGASSAKVYSASRLTAAEPTRLDVDAHLVSEWRMKGFHPVVADGPSDDDSRSVLIDLLDLKREHPLTAAADFTRDFTFDLNRKQTCVQFDRLEQYAREHPLWGMPYGLPGIDPHEYEVLRAWVQARLQATHRALDPLEYGAFDYNRLEAP